MRPKNLLVLLAILLSLLFAGCGLNNENIPPAVVNNYDESSTASLQAFEDSQEKVGIDGYSANADASPLAWGESYILMSYVAMYEGTGDIKYLQRLCLHADRIFANRDDRHERKDEIRAGVMPSWSTAEYSNGKRYCWLVHAGMITFPIARLVYLVKNNKRLHSELLNKALEYEKRLLETVNAFEPDWRDGPGNNESYYFCPYLQKALPLNQQNALGRTLVSLWLATGEIKFREKSEKMANYFRNRLRKTADKYSWDYWPEGTGAEDISHAAINVDFAFQCFRAGIVFDKGDMKCFCNTFKNLVVNGKGFTRNVDGSGNTDYSAQAGRWCHLAYIDTEVRNICFSYFKTNWRQNYVTGMLAAAYIVETNRPFCEEKPSNYK